VVEALCEGLLNKLFEGLHDITLADHGGRGDNQALNDGVSTLTCSVENAHVSAGSASLAVPTEVMNCLSLVVFPLSILTMTPSGPLLAEVWPLRFTLVSPPTVRFVSVAPK